MSMSSLIVSIQSAGLLKKGGGDLLVYLIIRFV